MNPRTLVIFIVALTATSASAANWWNPDWPYRCLIRCGAGEGNVAYARVPLAGRTTPDGRDLRLVDADHQPRAFEIIHHDPQLNTLIQLEVAPDQPASTWLYYGNPDAEIVNTLSPRFDETQRQRAAWREHEKQRQAALAKRREIARQLDRLRSRLQTVQRPGGDSAHAAAIREQIATLEQRLATTTVPEPHPEPDPAHAFNPRRGLLLRVYRKGRPGHPTSLRDFRRFVNPRQLEGADFRSAIADGFNPFGPSDQYISVYDGYLRIDHAGLYGFCTASDDGSWAIVNGRTVVSWPGAHGHGPGARGEKNGTIRLREGTARVQYWHEEGDGNQLAFLGWKPPGAEKYDAIPRDQWLPVRRARPATFQARGKALMAVPLVRTERTFWIPETENRQVTLLRFTDVSRSRAGEVIRREWSFGDGLTASGRPVTHAYFRLGRPQVTLTVADDAGNTDAITFAPRLFFTDALGAGRRRGRAPDFIAATAAYDPNRLPQQDLAGYIVFCRQLELWGRHVRAARAYLERFPEAEDTTGIARDAAQSCLQPQGYDPQLAATLLERVIAATAGDRERFTLMLDHAHVLAWHLEKPAAAAAIYDTLDRAARDGGAEPNDPLVRRLRIGQGDRALVTGQHARALKRYREAEQSSETPASQPERLAKIGGFAYTVEDLLFREQYAWARDTIDNWENELPSQKLEGLTFFLRGKVLFVEHPGPLALHYLKWAERVSPRALHVPESLWLRASCYEALNRRREACTALARITTEFTFSEFYEQALKKLQDCDAPE
jgi:hypothetical protein